MDHRHFWDKHLKLLKPLHEDTLHRNLMKKLRVGERDAWLRVKALTCSVPKPPCLGGSPLAQDVLFALQQQPRTYGKGVCDWFARDQHGWLLPESSENALWADECGASRHENHVGVLHTSSDKILNWNNPETG
jgi:hypothetical protein